METNAIPGSRNRALGHGLIGNRQLLRPLLLRGVTKLKIMNWALIAAFCLMSDGVLAQITEEKCLPHSYDVVRRELKISNLSPKQDGGNIISETCRTWPYNTDWVLAAFAYDEGVEYDKKLAVAVIDKKTEQVLSSFQSDIAEDAVTEIGETSIHLDTARYRLAKDIRAFGVRFNSVARGASCGDADWNDELTLLIPEGKRLRPAFSLTMFKQRSLKGCLGTAITHAVWETAELTIGVADTSTNGLKDLLVTAKITTNSDDSQTTKPRNRIERHILHYDGSAYQKGKSFPWWLEF